MIRKLFPTLLIEELSRHAWNNRLCRSTAIERNHRPARGHRLNRRHPEVFLLRMNVRLGVRVQLRLLGERNATEKFDVPFGHRLQLRLRRARTENLHRNAGFIGCLHHKVEPFVRNESSASEEITLWRIRNRKLRHINRRMDDSARCFVIFIDAFLHRRRIRDEMVDAICRMAIPNPQHREQGRQEHLDRLWNLELVHIAHGIRPQVTRRRVAVADVNGSRARDDAFGECTRARDHYIELPQVVGLRSGWHEGDVPLVAGLRERELLEERRSNVLVLERRHFGRIKNEGVGGCLGPDFLENPQHLFRTPVLDEVVVDNREFHEDRGVVRAVRVVRMVRGWFDLSPLQSITALTILTALLIRPSSKQNSKGGLEQDVEVEPWAPALYIAHI